jgi:predicted nucleic acid-binding protein
MTQGGDTGFLIGVIERQKVAVEYWQQVLDERSVLFISTISINELLTHYYKRGKGDIARKLIEEILLLGNATFVPVDKEIAERSAGYRYGLGIPTVDSILLATFVQHSCDVILTTDSHFEGAAEQDIIKVKMIQ